MKEELEYLKQCPNNNGQSALVRNYAVLKCNAFLLLSNVVNDIMSVSINNLVFFMQVCNYVFKKC